MRNEKKQTFFYREVTSASDAGGYEVFAKPIPELFRNGDDVAFLQLAVRAYFRIQAFDIGNADVVFGGEGINGAVLRDFDIACL